MNTVRVRRWVALALSGGLLALVAALGAGSVAADAGGCYVGALNSPANAQCVPPASSAAAYVTPGGIYYAPGDYTYPGVPGYTYPAGPYYPAYGAPVVAGGCCLTTQAGPIVGYGPNGSFLVYDVRGGTVDAYNHDANGNLCEADSNGNCIP